MAKIRHIALTTKNPSAVAEFYKEAFDMQEIRRSDNGAVFLSDGYINLAILNWKTGSGSLSRSLQVRDGTRLRFGSCSRTYLVFRTNCRKIKCCDGATPSCRSSWTEQSARRCCLNRAHNTNTPAWRYSWQPKWHIASVGKAFWTSSTSRCSIRLT